jgi:hypothetical protein
MPIQRQLNAKLTPLKLLIRAAQKQRLASSKLCRNVHLSTKKTAAKPAKKTKGFGFAISGVDTSTTALLTDLLCSLSRFTL